VVENGQRRWGRHGGGLCGRCAVNIFVIVHTTGQRKEGIALRA
jgi:hypothetical protein